MKSIIGYSYWGFLSDVKMDKEYNRLSTPDGNAFYSWSIIRALQKLGYVVTTILPDRDAPSVQHLGDGAFLAWASKARLDLYNKMEHVKYPININELEYLDIKQIWDDAGVLDFKYILHEWRMEIEGRNTYDCKHMSDWQPDLFLQDCLLKYCEENNIKLFIFDLDYKLDKSDVPKNATVLELGTKWEHIDSVNSKKVYIPFDFDFIDEFSYNDIENRTTDLIYIGNRYERDWCIDKYIPEWLEKCAIHGNWQERGRDSVDRWPKLDFRKRLQTEEMHDAYSDAICTILLAKKDYCEHSFMTARLIEAVFYDTVPLFIEEYGTDTICEYAGDWSNILTVKNKDDVCNRIEYFRLYSDAHREVIKYLRNRLKMMDAVEFVNILEEV